jgi:hypothetical protein
MKLNPFLTKKQLTFLLNKKFNIAINYRVDDNSTALAVKRFSQAA